MNQVIGIGEYIVSNNEEDKITTYALASCVAVTIYSQEKKISGMIHIALPEPMNDTFQSEKPGYYATTGIPILLNIMINQYGCRKEELLIQLFGGANSIRNDDVFNVGQKNLETIESMFSNYNLKYILKDVGGFVSRSIEMDVPSGTVRLETQPIRI